jgi:hypothetical protein
MGRRTKLTPDVQKAICDGIRGGLTYEQAAIFAGIAERTFHNWRTKGEKAKSGIYHQFVQELKKANVDARAIHIQRISKASQGGAEVVETAVVEKKERDPVTGNEITVTVETRTTKKKALPVWQASAWILERRFPTEFGKHIKPQEADAKDPMDAWLEALEEAEQEYSDA